MVAGFVFFSELTPVITYTDLIHEKSSVLKQNKGKSGIYMFTNKINGKRYVGSSLDLSQRFKNYLNISYLLYKKENMNIKKALVAYGFVNFKLDILEYCEPSVLFFFIKKNIFFFIKKYAS